MAETNKYNKLWPLLLASGLTVWPWSAGAFDAGKMDDFKTTNVCKYCDLTDAPLSGRDMRPERCGVAERQYERRCADRHQFEGRKNGRCQIG